jgi:hypothetical protein
MGILRLMGFMGFMRVYGVYGDPKYSGNKKLIIKAWVQIFCGLFMGFQTQRPSPFEGGRGDEPVPRAE